MTRRRKRSNGDITRDEAVALIRRYDGEYSGAVRAGQLRVSEPAREGISRGRVARSSSRSSIAKYFERLTDRFRSPHIWMLKDGSWKLRKAIYDGA